MKVVLDEGAKIPTKAHPWDAGWDLYAKKKFVVPGSKCDDGFGVFYDNMPVVIGSSVHDTGVHVEIPEGYVGFIKSKSGLNVKHGITAEGVIDCGYTGSIIVKLYNHTSEPYVFNAGDKITQLVILPINTDSLDLVDGLDDTERGENGFGSSGR